MIAGPNENRQLGAPLAARIAWPAGVGGLILLVVAVLVAWLGEAGWERFLRAYLVAFCFVLSLCPGGLSFTMLHPLTRAGWSVVVRRIAEGLAGNLRWLWVLFIPIVIGLFTTDLYHWRHIGDDVLLEHKEPFLNTTFWLIRAVIYFVVWAGLAHFFVSNSVAQDASGDSRLTLRMQRVAAPGMILYGFTQTFAIIDWVMALEPHWYSTMFGVYFFAASCCGFGATLIILCFALQRTGRVADSITTEHYQDLGKFLCAFGIVFWAYIAYSQYMLIWYANIPEETGWFAARQLGGWQGLSILLIVGHFAGPFMVLISRHPKRWRGFLAAAAVWMLVIHFIDIYWLAMPAVPVELIASVSTYAELVAEFELTYAETYDLHWSVLDPLCVLGLLGLGAAGTAAGLRRVSLIPEGDPRLQESLAFENY
ncbi:MAG: quinol:cytochrome C oxidoreductase [Planctomycetota bacterium]